jgi:16S rRNA processing protein RimM
MAEPFVPLGAIATTHGLDGWLKFNPFNADTSALVAGRHIVLDLGDHHGEFELAANAKPARNQLLIKLHGVDHIDAAQRWVGATLSVHERDLAPLAPGEFYHYQVIGFEVLQKNGASIGTLAAILTTAGNDILVVKNGGKEVLIPAVKEIVDRVDFDRQRIIVDPPEGLLDL